MFCFRHADGQNLAVGAERQRPSELVAGVVTTHVGVLPTLRPRIVDPLVDERPALANLVIVTVASMAVRDDRAVSTQGHGPAYPLVRACAVEQLLGVRSRFVRVNAVPIVNTYTTRIVYGLIVVDFAHRDDVAVGAQGHVLARIGPHHLAREVRAQLPRAIVVVPNVYAHVSGIGQCRIIFIQRIISFGAHREHATVSAQSHRHPASVAVLHALERQRRAHELVLLLWE